MRVLGVTGAEYFCRGFSGAAATRSTDLFRLLETSLRGQRSFNEGGPGFPQLRDCLLRETDRSIFLASACFSSALSGLRPGSVFWTVVGLYYAAFFLAKAILGFFGCWFRSEDCWIEAARATPGGLELRYERTRYRSRVKGSHQVFWDAYYSALLPLAPWFGPSAAVAVTPVGGDRLWLTKTRNSVNYTPTVAFELLEEFEAGFNSGNVAGSLPARVATLTAVVQASFGLAGDLSGRFGFRTDVYHPAFGSRLDAIRTRITNPAHLSLSAYAQAVSARGEV